jgi:hypothetical protein
MGLFVNVFPTRLLIDNAAWKRSACSTLSWTRSVHGVYGWHHPDTYRSGDRPGWPHLGREQWSSHEAAVYDHPAHPISTWGEGRVGQFRIYFADVTPGRSGEGGATLMGGVGASAARMNGYPKVFNTESDPREEHNIGEMYEWVIGPILKAVGEYKASVEKHPNPPAANLTRW